MSALWSREEAERATGARSVGGDWRATGVSIDSREIAPGDLFVGLKGPSFDGADFAAPAFEAGAAAAMVSREVEGGPCLIVEDGLAGLEALGAAARRRSRAAIAAITGSVGKTGVKDALRFVLARQGGCHASAKSHNNHWGVPLSLARLPEQAPFAAFELGMNAPGEIRALVARARPHVAAITAIAPAHIGFFENERAIARAKAEIFEGLEPGGIAIVPADGEHAAFLAESAAGAGGVVSFGRSEDADWRAVAIEAGFDATRVAIEARGRRFEGRIGWPGEHWGVNAALILAVVDALGGDPARALTALAGLEPGAGRGQRRAIALRDGEAIVLDESYNANPASMRAALSVLAKAPGRKLAALGQMLELGADSARMHRELASAVLAAGVDRLYAVGPDMAELCAALAGEIEVTHAEHSLALERPLKSELRAGDALLVKGSLGSKMGALVEALAPPSGPI